MFDQHKAPTEQTRVTIINNNQGQVQIPQHSLALTPLAPKRAV